MFGIAFLTYSFMLQSGQSGVALSSTNSEDLHGGGIGVGILRGQRALAYKLAYQTRPLG